MTFRAQCASARALSRHAYFSRTLSIFVFIALICYGFSLLFHGNQSLCQAVTVFSRAQAAILRSSGHSVNEIAKLFKKTEQWVNQWSKESPSRTKQGVSGRPFVLTNYARNIIKKAKYERNNLTRKIAKRPQHHNINASS